VLVKLFLTPTNKMVQCKVCSILAEISIENDKGKEQMLKEVGTEKLVSLLKTSVNPTISNDLCRILANVTNGNRTAQKDVIKHGGLELLISLVKSKAMKDEDISVSALTALANLVQILEEENGNMREEIANAAVKENLIQLVLQSFAATDTEMQQQAVRVLLSLVLCEPLGGAVVKQDGVATITKLLVPASNSSTKFYAVSTISRLSQVDALKPSLRSHKELMLALKDLAQTGDEKTKQVAQRVVNNLD